MEARRAGICTLCCDAIEKGERVLPVDIALEPDGPVRTHWLHQHCVAEHDRAECKHWQRTGKCLYESSCVFAHPPPQAAPSGACPGIDAGQGDREGEGAGDSGDEDSEGRTRTWQRESERGQPVRLHASRIPMCLPIAQVRSVFAQYGELVDNIELRPMKANRPPAELGWCIVKYVDYAAASRAVEAINGRLRFDSNSGEVMSCGDGSVPGGGVKMSGTKERGLEWERINREVKIFKT